MKKGLMWMLLVVAAVLAGLYCLYKKRRPLVVTSASAGAIGVPSPIRAAQVSQAAVTPSAQPAIKQINSTVQQVQTAVAAGGAAVSALSGVSDAFGSLFGGGDSSDSGDDSES